METSIKAYTRAGLESLMKELGQPRFRAQQVYEWLYAKHAASYDDMTNLPAALRAQLSEQLPLQPATVVDRQVSADGTRKYLIEYCDGAQVEAVAIPSEVDARLTVCFSTQAGCAMACAFCATGREGFTRNLLPGEIVEQVLIAQDDMGARVTNVVAMGQGEPFLNYDNVLAALRILNDPKGVGLGARHIAVSTCGIVPGIERFADEPEQFTLAVSLHATNQAVRDILMPKAEKFRVRELRAVLGKYTEKTNRRVTLEYIMIDGVNDDAEALEGLCRFCTGLLCHVNLIPINAVPGSPFEPSSKATVDAWLATLPKRGTEATLRHSRGSDIAGACGQLKNSRTQR